MARKTKNYTDEFKKQIVALKQNVQLSAEYGIAKSTIVKQVNNYNQSGSFNAKYNRTDEENELLHLRKENKQLLIENEILKQTALIMARKYNFDYM